MHLSATKYCKSLKNIHEIVNLEVVFILPCAAVRMEMDLGFTKSMVFEHQYNCVCSLPHVKALINEIVDLKREAPL